MDERSLKDHIRRVREDLGMTQEEFALELGIDTSTYWRLEDGKTRLISPYLYKIAEYAQMTVADIVAGRDIEKALGEASEARGQLDTQRAWYERRLAEKDDTIANLNRLIAELKK